MTIRKKSKQDIENLKLGGKLLSETLFEVAEIIKPGISTKELNLKAEEFILQKGAKPSFKGFDGFPAALCTSVNEQLVHGIPTDYRLKEGDIIGIDCGLWYKGLCTDMALTVPVGKIDKDSQDLIDVTKTSLDIGLEMIKPGNTIGDYGFAVQKFVENKNLTIIRGLVGHGVGYEVHEPPQIPNFGEQGKGLVFESGMVIALEPMASRGDYNIITADDGWTISMADGSRSAHFEVTLALTDDGYEIITPKIW